MVFQITDTLRQPGIKPVPTNITYLNGSMTMQLLFVKDLYYSLFQ